MNLRVFLIGLCLLITHQGISQENAYHLEQNIPYYSAEMQASDAYIRQRCVLDFYYPADSVGYATVIWFHGGGLRAGKKHFPVALKQQGLAIAAVNYRLHPKVKVPAYMKDAAAAVAWVFKNAEHYRGDPERIFVAGHSAGAYLASMVGLDKKWLAGHEIDADRLAGILALSGPAITPFTIRRDLGLAVAQPVVDAYAPVNHVRAKAPPLLLITGARELELAGRYEENAYWARMMELAGHGETQLMELDGYGHNMTAPAFPLMLKEIRRIISGNRIGLSDRQKRRIFREVQAAVTAFHAADTSLHAQGVIDLLWPEYNMFADGKRVNYADVVAGAPQFMASLRLFHTVWSDLQITALKPDIAISTFTFRDSIISKDGELTQKQGPNTFVWQKRNGEWRVIFGDADHYPVRD